MCLYVNVIAVLDFKDLISRRFNVRKHYGNSTKVELVSPNFGYVKVVYLVS